MPNYSFYCLKCGSKKTVNRLMKDYELDEICGVCDIKMERDFNCQRFHCGNKEYGNPLISESLGIHPEQAEEHRKNHPNVEVMPEGQLKFDNYQDHNNYLNKIAWDKKESRRKRISR